MTKSNNESVYLRLEMESQLTRTLKVFFLIRRYLHLNMIVFIGVRFFFFLAKNYVFDTILKKNYIVITIQCKEKKEK